MKAVVCDPDSLDILWSDYQRHETRQPEKTLDFLVRIGNAFPDAEDIKIFCTGSGSSPLAEPTGARFVQEANAVTMAVECWRMRIPETWETWETWETRGYDYPRDMPIEELIFTPENAEYYAAFGAVIFGLVDNVDDTAGRYKGLDELKTYIHTGRGERLGEMADGPLVENAEELEAFKRPPHKMAGVATNLVYAIWGTDRPLESRYTPGLRVP